MAGLPQLDGAGTVKMKTLEDALVLLQRRERTPRCPSSTQTVAACIVWVPS